MKIQKYKKNSILPSKKAFFKNGHFSLFHFVTLPRKQLITPFQLKPSIAKGLLHVESKTVYLMNDFQKKSLHKYKKGQKFAFKKGLFKKWEILHFHFHFHFQNTFLVSCTPNRKRPFTRRIENRPKTTPPPLYDQDKKAKKKNY